MIFTWTCMIMFWIASFYNYSLPDYLDFSKSYDRVAMIAVPRWTKVRICNVGGKCIDDIIVNDFWPQYTGRIVDMIQHLFAQLCSTRRGLCNVMVEVE